MGLFGSILGAAGSIFGGIKASQAMKAVNNDLEDQRSKNQDWYDRRYNEDSTQRADAQALLARTEEAIKKRTQAAAGTAAVMGGTDESVAAEKEAANKLMSDAVSQINAAGEARKDQIENQYMQNESNLRAQQNNLRQKKAQAIAGAVQGVTNAASMLPI